MERSVLYSRVELVGWGNCANFGDVDRHSFTDLRIRLIPEDDGAPQAVTFAFAHRFVLAAASPVVQAILSAPGFRETRQDGRQEQEDHASPVPPGHSCGNEITVGGISAQTFEILLDFVYSGAVVVRGLEQVLLLYKAADQLDVQTLRAACLEFVDSLEGGWYGGSAAVELVLLAQALDLDCIRSRFTQYIMDHLEVVAVASPSDVWRLLPLPLMADIMRAGVDNGDRDGCESAYDAELLFTAWAEWCGGPWADLADLTFLSLNSARVHQFCTSASPTLATPNIGQEEGGGHQETVPAAYGDGDVRVKRHAQYAPPTPVSWPVKTPHVDEARVNLLQASKHVFLPPTPHVC